jgi:hypothetical protein
MSRREVVDCDRCGRTAEKSARVFLRTDRRADAAGSAEDVGETLDLCIKCCERLIIYLTENSDFVTNRATVAWITRGKK